MGKANNLKTRVASYLRDTANLGPRTSVMVNKIASVSHVLVASELEALLLEANLIKKYEPQFNVRWTDGKAYPFIKITVKDAYPAVLQSRKIDDKKSLFFGPFPNIGDVRRILKSVRKIFPYQSVRNHSKKHCLYYHIGLCPCPPLLDTKGLGKYRRNIQRLIQFLKGKKGKVVIELEREMIAASQKDAFEEASRIKHQIDVIKIITSPTRRPVEYIQNPNLLSDEAKLDLESLQSILSTYLRRSAPNSLLRIECYDISNIQGKQATGSMVVAIEGQIDKSQYRRFRIRFKDIPDDLAMHREMLNRRLKHTEWLLPNLIVIDGGVGQVNVATTVINENGLIIPVIGLAKRLEEIVFLASQGDPLQSKNVQLPRNHRALKLLQRLRDEAHRFAITYHRKLRQKQFLGK